MQASVSVKQRVIRESVEAQTVIEIILRVISELCSRADGASLTARWRDYQRLTAARC